MCRKFLRETHSWGPFSTAERHAGSYVYAFTQPIFMHVHNLGRVPGAAFLVVMATSAQWL